MNVFHLLNFSLIQNVKCDVSTIKSKKVDSLDINILFGFLCHDEKIFKWLLQYLHKNLSLTLDAADIQILPS